MADRKVYVLVTARIIMKIPEGIEVQEVITDMDYDFISGTEGVRFLDTKIRDHEEVEGPK